MSDYLDTNAVWSLIFQDAHSDAITAWLAQSLAPLAISDWTEAEFLALANRRVRADGLTSEAARTGIADFNALAEGRFDRLSLSPSVGALSVQLTREPKLKLSAPDALHLAVCTVNESRLVTFDVRLADAARARGINVASIPSEPSPAPH